MKLNHSIIIILCILTCICKKAQAQNSSKMLIGEWRLDSIGYKKISPSEKQKRYSFKADSLQFKSRKISTGGLYKMRSDGVSFEWSIPETSKPLLTMFSFINSDTLRIADGTNPSDYGYLVRISENAIVHYRKGIQAEKEKKFEVAFWEFSNAAQLQHPDAMYKLGMHYFTGTATKLDEKEGSKWIREAAKLGNPEAQAVVNSNSLKY